MEKIKLTVEEFQSLLERELVQFAVCYLLFNNEHKNKYADKMNQHEGKILNISSRLKNGSIFDTDNILDMYLAEILPNTGIPFFTYRNESAFEKFSTSIKLGVFKTGSEVELVMPEIQNVVVKVVRNLVNTNELIVSGDGISLTVPYDNVICPVKRETVKQLLKSAKWKK